MKTKKLPSQQYLRVCLDYFPDTGKLFWKHRPLEHFKHAREYRRWNTRYAGTEAFTAVHPTNGGRIGRLNKSTYWASRLILKWLTGKDPACWVDHKDRNRDNNKADNLRPAEPWHNCVNIKQRSDNISGVAGVGFTQNRWRARISIKRTVIHLGRFATKEEATAARLKAEKEFHGEYSPRWSISK